MTAATSLTIVTGGSSGIGARIAARAGDDGHDVIVVSRSPGDFGRHVPADLSVPEGWDVFAALADHEVPGRSRVEFFHCAGTIDPIGFAGEVEPGGYRTQVVLNGAAPQILGDALLRALAGAGVEAMLVFLTSGAARTVYPGWSAYCAGKAAVDHWVRTVGAEQAERRGARVLAIAPGVVATPMQERIRGTDARDFPKVERFRSLVRDGELGDPDDVARRLRLVAPRLANGSVVDLRDL
ncbi:MAG TPA: SDR family NAD(P)-dependent oxidoreductase [Acidimicrobiia bacterium]|nr:SDR family NAD(P)-dependent oxidoreductase [Acidimicrobiia bacterium]